MSRIQLGVIFILFSQLLCANNPIISNRGANDPHVRIIDGKAYLSASHDKSIDNKQFCMEDWWLWSSDDLVNWQLESVLKPEDTYIGDNGFDRCWATDIVKRNGKFYWYFSEGNEQTGVVVSDSPQGPWRDPLGKALLSAEMTPTHEYDMGIVEDEAGEFYIVFGVWDYYIAKLNEDMISLAEAPRKIDIKDPRGPYNLEGNNKEKPTDDKPFMHFYNGKYYLSWGCFYAMSDNVYGPFVYKGSIIEEESFAPGYDAPTWPTGFHQGRHGSFFQWHNQWYFAYCDISQTGNRYFRDTFISYIHYKKNGEMALIRVDGVGVANYDANKGIEAEDYYTSAGIAKEELDCAGFGVKVVEDEAFLVYSNVSDLASKQTIALHFTVRPDCMVELRKASPQGELLAQAKCSTKNSTIAIGGQLKDKEDLCFVFKGKSANGVVLDAILFE